MKEGPGRRGSPLQSPIDVISLTYRAHSKKQAVSHPPSRREAVRPSVRYKRVGYCEGTAKRNGIDKRREAVQHVSKQSCKVPDSICPHPRHPPPFIPPQRAASLPLCTSDSYTGMSAVLHPLRTVFKKDGFLASRL